MANNIFSAKSNNMNTSWLKNAMRSIGSSYATSITEIAPNTSAAFKAGIQTANSIGRLVRGAETRRIQQQVNNNRYVKFARTLYQNAAADIKSGKLNNTDRMADLTDTIEAATESGLSFSDDSGEDTNVNVNVVGAGFTDLSDAVNRQSLIQIEMHKADTDAMIAMNSASMQQIGTLGAEIVNQLTNVNNNLAAIVQYNNSTMNRFVEASMAYYESTGSLMEKEFGDKDKSKIRGTDVIKAGGKGVSFNKYKELVKKQLLQTVENSPGLGSVKALIEDDTMMNMLASNPVGFATNILTSYMMPKVVQTSLETMEQAMNNFVPDILTQVGGLSKSTKGGVQGILERFIGNVFGINMERNNSFKDAKINRGPIPFDGETKHAITEVITKELRDQTGYLKIIAERYDKNAQSKVRENGEYWDWNTNSYIKRGDINNSITNMMTDAVVNAFSSSLFGRELQGAVTAQHGDRAQKDVQNTINELYTMMERQTDHLSMQDIIGLVEATGGSNQAKKVVRKWIEQMGSKNQTAFNSRTSAQLSAQSAMREVRDEIRQNPTLYHLFDSEYANAEDIDAIYNQQVTQLNAESHRQARRRNYRYTEGDYDRQERARNASKVGNTYSERGKSSLVKVASGFVEDVANNAAGIMNSMMTGDPIGVLQKSFDIVKNSAVTVGKEAANFLFGNKTDANAFEGGLLSGLANNFMDITRSVRSKITGEAYVDSQGVHHEAPEDSIFGSVKNLGGMFKDTVKKGLGYWQDAFFGNDSSDPNIDGIRQAQMDELKNKIKDRSQSMLIGGMTGAGIGAISGGSILGAIIGGPMAGAAIGAATGFLSKNEKFQEYLFGPEDEEGNRLGGLISKQTQDFFKEKKDQLFKGGVIGGVAGAALGSGTFGVLGTLVGGPISGALLGMAANVTVRSKTFQEFLFGNEEENKEGIIKAISRKFNEGFRKTSQNGEEGDINGTKLLSMSLVGTTAGGLLGTLAGGPVVGAMIGLATSIRASSSSFKEFLFGKEDGLTLADGTTTKKQGLFGKFGNMLDANIIQPIKNEVSYIIEDTKTTIKHDILGKLTGIGKFFSEKAGELTGRIGNFISKNLQDFAQGAGENTLLGRLASSMSNVVGKGLTGIMDMVYSGVSNVVKAPVKFLAAFAKAINLKDRLLNNKFVKGLRNVVSTGVHGLFTFTKGLIKDAFGIIFSPIKLLGKGISGLARGIGRGVRWVGDRTGLGDRFREFGTRFSNALHGNEDISDINNADSAARREHAQNRANLRMNRAINKNDRLIAKLTNNQFAKDSEEARLWLMQHDPAGWQKFQASVNKEAATESFNRQRTMKEAIHGKGTQGMTRQVVSGVAFNTLSEEGQQVYLLNKLVELMGGGNGSSGNEDDDNANIEDAQNIIRDYASGMSVKELSQKYGISRKKLKKLLKSKGATGANFQNTEAQADDESQDAEQKPSGFMANTRMNLSNLFSLLAQGFRRPGHATGGSLLPGANTVMDNELVVSKDGGEEVIANSEHTSDEERKNRKNKLRGALTRSNSVGEAAENSARLSDLHQEEVMDAASDSMRRAQDVAKTADEIRAQKEAEAKEKKMMNLWESMRDNIMGQRREAKEHHFAWDKIFSKKGLITGLVIGGALLLKKFLPKVFNVAGKIIGGIAKGISFLLGLFTKDFNDADTHKSRTNGNSIGEQLEDNIEDIMNGNIFTNSMGEATAQTVPRLKFAANLANRGMRLYRNLFNGGKLGQGPIGRAGTKIKEFGKSALNNLDDYFRSDWSKRGLKGTGVQFADDGSRIISKTGFESMTSGMDDMERALFKQQNGFEVVDDVSKFGKTKLGSKVDDIGKAVGKTKVGKAVGSAAQKTGTALKSMKDTSSKLLGNIKKWLDNFFDAFCTKFKIKPETLGKLKPTSIFNVLKSKWDDICVKIAEKLGPITGGKATAAAVSAGLTEVGFATIGAIDGLTGTAKLFGVDKSKIDGTMKTISAAFGAITGTMVGSIIDVIFAFAGDLMGVNIMRELATTVYNFMVGFDSEKAEQLDKAQNEWKDQYYEYQKEQIDKEYENQKKAGLLDPNMTKEDFYNGVMEGSQRATYKSLDDWNVDQNRSMIDKAATGVGKVFKKAKWGVQGFFTGHKEYTDSEGRRYVQNQDGTYHVYDANGQDTGADINKRALPEDAKKLKTESGLSKLGDTIKDVFGKLFTGSMNIGKSIFNYVMGKSDDLIEAKDDNVALKVANTLGKFALTTPRSMVMVGKGIVGFIGKAFTAMKNIWNNLGTPALDYVLGNTDRIQFAIPEDNPGKPIIDALEYISMYALQTPRLGVKIAKTIGSNIKDMISAVPDLAEMSRAYITGESDDFMEVDSGDVIGHAANLVAKFSLALPKYVYKIGKTTVEGVKKLGEGARAAFAKATELAGNAKDYVTFKSNTFIETEEDDVFGNAVNSIGEFILNGPRNIYMIFKAASLWIGEKVKQVKEVGASVSDTVSSFMSGETDEIEFAIDEENPMKPMLDLVKGVMQNILYPLRFAKNIGTSAANKLKEIGGSMKDALTGAWQWITGDNGGSGRGFRRGGRGHENLNGHAYYSQVDPRWGGAAYNMGFDRATMADTGCGPAAMAMAATDVTGREYNPMMLAEMAKMTGNRDSTGTNWNFINDSSHLLGLSTQQMLNPTPEMINAAVDSGQPVILAGASGRGFRRGGGGRVPYTSAGHYVVAVGRDKNGNIIVNDPRGHGYSGSYNVRDLASHTGSSWIIGGHGVPTNVQAKLDARKLSQGASSKTYKTTIPGMPTADILAAQKQGTYDTMMSNLNGVGMASDKSAWMSIVKATKEAMAAAAPVYSQSAYITLSVGGKQMSVRTDCSGYVGACLKFYGVFPEGENLTSRSFLNGGTPSLQSSGFTPGGWPGWEGLEEGDIISRDGHVEIFSHNDGGKHYVYSCGSTNSIRSPGPTVTGHPDGYTAVWRPGPAGTGCVMGSSISGSAASGGASIAGGSAAASSSGGGLFSKLTSYIGGFISSFGEKALTGLATGDWNSDYSDVLNGVLGIESGGTTSGGVTGSSDATIAGGSTYSSSASAGLTGNNTTEMVWNYLKSQGFTDQAAAGVMGNLQQESGINPAVHQNGGGPAKGLAQWEGTRWENLVAFAQQQGKDPYDLGVQLDFLMHELNGGDSTTAGILNRRFGGLVGLKAMTNINQAADAFEQSFERAGKPMMDKRYAFANDFYNMYATTGISTSIPTSAVNAARAQGNVGLLVQGGSGSGIFSNKRFVRGGRGPLDGVANQAMAGVNASVMNTGDIYSNTETRADQFITTNNKSDPTAMIMNIIKILAEIAANTGNASTKLDMLKSLSNLSNITVSNSYSGGGVSPSAFQGSNASSAVSGGTSNYSDNSRAAHVQIARGGI